MRQRAGFKDDAGDQQHRHADQRQPGMDGQYRDAGELAEQQIPRRPGQRGGHRQPQGDAFSRDGRIKTHHRHAGKAQRHGGDAWPADLFTVEDDCEQQAERHAQLPGDGQRRDIVRQRERQPAQPHEQRAGHQPGDEHDPHPSRLPAQPGQARHQHDAIAQRHRCQRLGIRYRQLHRHQVEGPDQIDEQDEREMAGLHAPARPVARA